MTTVAITVYVEVDDEPATMALAREVAAQEGWGDYAADTLADAVVDIVNCGANVGYLRWFAEVGSGWAAEIAEPAP